MEIGERIINLHRLNSIRDGYFQIEDDILQSHILSKSFNNIFDLQSYYHCHGWDIHGKPTYETLKRLKLDTDSIHNYNV